MYDIVIIPLIQTPINLTGRFYIILTIGLEWTLAAQRNGLSQLLLFC